MLREKVHRAFLDGDSLNLFDIVQFKQVLWPGRTQGPLGIALLNDAPCKISSQKLSACFEMIFYRPFNCADKPLELSKLDPWTKPIW